MRRITRLLTLAALAVLFSGAAQAAGYIGIRPVPTPGDWPHDWYYWHYHHHHHHHHHHWHWVPPPHWPRIVQELQPLTVREHLVKVTVKNQVATTTVEQCFYNPNGRQLEGQFIFPFEDDTAVSAFSMWMNGKETKGELLDAQKARGIYEDIVRRMQDPGLLEYVGRRMFKCRVFPIAANGECRVKLTYSRPLSADADLVEFAYPMRGGQPAASGGKFVFSVDLEDSREILSLYSPTHKLDVVRKNSRHLAASFEGQPGEKDFKLFYNVSRKDVGLSFIAYRPEGEDGTFMAILTPRDTADEQNIVAKDVVFVLDTSGSMQEDGKIDQARKALKFCLASLREKDRFALVTFATEAQVYLDGLESATKAAVTKAIEHVDKKVVASGGTAIDEALREALKLNTGGDRPFMVVFLTDGEPTIGERDPKRIAGNVKSGVKDNVRLFSFGVGADVNAALLDDLATTGRGTCTYVVPKEDIEVKLSAFYSRVSSPVLTDIKLDLGALDAYDVCPRKFGDLFRDQQLVVVGRYRGKGGAALKLSGRLGAREKEIVYEVKAPEKETGNDFLPRVWAMRKVGQLMEDVRQHGESAELRAEIVRLSKLHGIMTPYTSWLVVEDERQLVAGRVPAPVTGVIREDFDRRRGQWRQSGGAGPAPAAPGAAFAPAREAPASAAGKAADMGLAEHARALRDESASGMAFGSRGSFEADKKQRAELLGNESDKAEQAAQSAVMGGGGYDSLANRQLAATEGLKADGTYALKDGEGRSLLREVGGRAFYLADGRWVDGGYKGEETVKVKYMSDEYFKLLKDKPEMAKFLALGNKLIARYGGKFYEVTE